MRDMFSHRYAGEPSRQRIPGYRETERGTLGRFEVIYFAKYNGRNAKGGPQRS